MKLNLNLPPKTYNLKIKEILKKYKLSLNGQAIKNG